MSPVAIVTDSTAYLPEQITRQYNITVLPLSIIWEGVSYRDGVDIQPTEFYRRLQSSKELPTTSQITTSTFQECFASLIEQGNDVLAIFLSSQFSGTYQAAVKAREAMAHGHEKVAVVDSCFTTMAMTLPVILGARAAASGESLAACQLAVEYAIANTGVLFVPDTLEYLRRGGRIGGAQALLGTALNIKPLLGMHEGHIEAIERIRKKSAAVARMIEVVKERVGKRTPVRLGASHCDAEEEANAMLATACIEMQAIETFCQPLSPVVGAHVGPGTVALSYTAGI